jgi:hypothetical protein
MYGKIAVGTLPTTGLILGGGSLALFIGALALIGAGTALLRLSPRFHRQSK